MKTLFKFILSFICYLLFIPCVLGLSVSAAWYLLPAAHNTYMGQLIETYLESQEIFIATIVLFACAVVFMGMGKLFTVIKSSKALNFYTHLVSWLLALALAFESGYIFFASDSIQTAAMNLSFIRRVGILSCVVALLLYAILSPKVRKLVDRRIQAYDTAKELNAEGRSSVIGMQILKCFDFICPEIFLLIALCFAFNWEISLYFIFIICSFVFPILGNMVCDHRVKRESKRKKAEFAEAQVNATAEAVVDLLKQQN